MIRVAGMFYIHAGYCCPDKAYITSRFNLQGTAFSAFVSPERFVRGPGISSIVVVYVLTFIIAEYIHFAPMKVHFDVFPLFNGIFFKIFVGFSSV